MNTPHTFGLSTEVIEKLNHLFSQFPLIEKVIIYGSRAKGSFRLGSDIDLVLVAPLADTNLMLKIENEIDDLLLAYKFDLSLLHQIDNKNLIDHINRIGKNFYLKN